ncbi:MAG: citryl-CoA lyase [Kofleriaceae bacterium]
MTTSKSPTTNIATSDTTSITVRDHSLVDDLIGKVTFTEMMWLVVLGTKPTPAQAAIADACMVTLMEHGMTPSAIATRLIYGSSPDAMQGAIAAGLLGVGSRFVGTVEGCAHLLKRIVASPEQSARRAEADAIVREHKAIPGFGHDVHVPDDPRPARLFAVAKEHGLAGAHVQALETLGAALDAAKKRHITINATGAVAAVLADAGVPIEIMRGFAIVARCAGLVGHVREEQRDPSMRALWHGAEAIVPYRGGDK